MVSKSSKRWLHEHFTDPYVKKAQQEGYRSRAVYKLLEINARDRLFKPGMVVVELGAAPGSWSQVISRLVMPKGKVVALDVLAMEPLPNVEFLQGDFTEQAVEEQLQAHLAQHTIQQVDWVISDMAPNLSGNESIDIPRTLYLAELAVEFALKILAPSGGVLVKVFQGSGVDGLLATLRANFTQVQLRKPKASRGRSREVYILARNRRK